MGHSLFIDRIDIVIRFLLYVLIFWLPYSPAVIESCVIVCFLLWLVKRALIFIRSESAAHTLRGKIFEFLKAVKPESTFLNKPIGIFFFVCALSVTSSAFWQQSLHNFITKTLEWFVVYFLVVETFKEKRHVYTAAGIFLFTAFSTAVDSLIQFHITNRDIFLGNVIEPASRATAGFKTSNSLGGYLSLCIPFLFAWVFLGCQKISYRMGGLLLLFVFIWSFVITFSRAAWIGAFFGIVFLLTFISSVLKKSNYFSFKFFWAIAISGVLVVFLMPDRFGQMLVDRPKTVGWRWDIWQISLMLIKDKMFFGHGINTFMKVFQAYRGNNMMEPTYAHNCYLQMAAEAGLVGLFCFMWIIIKLFQQAGSRIKTYWTQDVNLAAVAVGLLSGILAFLVHSFFDTNFYSLQLSVYLWLMIGILVAVCQISDNTINA